ncbi:protein of unknown function [Paraburkholderia kururiensis]
MQIRGADPMSLFFCLKARRCCVYLVGGKLEVDARPLPILNGTGRQMASLFWLMSEDQPRRYTAKVTSE